LAQEGYSAGHKTTRTAVERPFPPIEHLNDKMEGLWDFAVTIQIRRAEQDSLGRSGVAESFARQVLALDVTEGVVVGVLGKWGSGKTSFVNLVRTEFARAGATILDFNPWMFSGAQQLVESLFCRTFGAAEDPA
jgi:predicted KAP-like P-loop ATPase